MNIKKQFQYIYYRFYRVKTCLGINLLYQSTPCITCEVKCYYILPPTLTPICIHHLFLL